MSIVITPESKKSWDRAIATCRLVKPLVRVIGFGKFDVRGRDHKTFYRVEFGKDAGGEFVATCNCKSHLLSGKPRPCYHIPAAAVLYKGQVMSKAAPTAPAATPTGSNGSAKCVICGESWPGSALSKRAICPACEINS